MKKDQLDALDKKIVHLLGQNGRAPISELAQRLEITVPTVRARIKRLVDSGVFRTAGLIDPLRLDGIYIALVGINLVLQGDLDRKVEMAAALEHVHWAGVVTGRFDLLVEVVCTGGSEEFYDFLAHELPKLGGVQSTETFVILKSSGKWIFPPPQEMD